METPMSIQVNGVEISEAAVAREVQYHPAPSLDEARSKAVQALVVRELLLQEAHRQAVTPEFDEEGESGEDFDDALVRTLLERAVTVPEPAEAECRAEYERQPERWSSPDLYEAVHILIPAAPTDQAARAQAKKTAGEILAQLQADPRRFAELARAHSACPSAAEGGSLGQFTADQMVPEFMTFIQALEPGQLCPVPAPTPYGYHIIRLTHRERGRPLPFDRVRERVAVALYDRRWRQAVHRFISQLVRTAMIQGAEIETIQ